MADNGRSRIWLWILIGGGAFFLFVLAVFTLVFVAMRASGRQAGIHGFGDKIGVVDLEGVILDPKEVVDQLRRFADDDSVKAIIIHVNSPGGGVAASEEIYREVKRVRDDKKKRIVASIETVGASGAYYVSSATNKIYADNGSVVGSIRTSSFMPTMSRQVRPMLATFVDEPFDRGGWLFEIKWYGHRAIAEVGRGAVRVTRAICCRFMSGSLL